MDIDRFREALTWRCINHTHENDIDKMTQWTQEVITDACNYSMPIVAPVHKKSVYWWSDRIAEMRKSCCQARRRWQKEKRRGRIEVILEKEDIYRTKKIELRTEIKRAKAKAWNELIQSIDTDPWGLPYRIVLKKLRRSSPSFSETLSVDVLE